MNSEQPLLILHDKVSGERWERPLTQEVLTIGRDPECELTLPDRQISRRHATILHREDHYIVRDEGSRNGTFLNGMLVSRPQRLRDGDEIALASRFGIIFVASEATAPLYRRGPTPHGLYVDPLTRSVWVEGIEVEPQLSVAQYRLLQLLYDCMGSACSRDDIAQTVWADQNVQGVSDQAIDALVRRLRHRLSETGSQHDYIEAVRGFGFRLKQP